MLKLSYNKFQLALTKPIWSQAMALLLYDNIIINNIVGVHVIIENEWVEWNTSWIHGLLI